MDCVPAYVAAASFTALILLDLGRKDWQQVPRRFLFGVVVVLILTYLCQAYGQKIGWILLSIPVVAVLFGLFLKLDLRPADQQATQVPDCSCPCCHVKPCHCLRPCIKPNPCLPKAA
jgi:hypothetical protein